MEKNYYKRHLERGYDCDVYKNKTFTAKKRRKIVANVTFTVLCVIAIIIIIAVFYLYTN